MRRLHRHEFYVLHVHRYLEKQETESRQTATIQKRYSTIRSIRNYCQEITDTFALVFVCWYNKKNSYSHSRCLIVCVFWIISFVFIYLCCSLLIWKLYTATQLYVGTFVCDVSMFTSPSSNINSYIRATCCLFQLKLVSHAHLNEKRNQSHRLDRNKMLKQMCTE